MRRRVLARFALQLAGTIAGFGVLAVAARSADVTTVSPLQHDLQVFRTLGTVLHVGAHPDDENTQLIASFSRGRGYRTAYLSLTRGDGGQNESGPEFGEKLGLARTQELLAARQLDGGRQFFTRAIDFGFSKSPEETLRFWDHDAILGDVVRVIREFRPDVIITRFPVPPGSGGHGQHTASAMLALEAFKIAGDPKAYPEQLAQGLTPWQPKRIGWNAWGDTKPLTGPVIQFDTGGADPVSGEPFATLANRSRAMHKTQGLSFFAARTGGPGPNLQNFLLLAGDAPAQDIMDGVDTSWARIPGGAALIPRIDDVIAKFSNDDPAASVPALLSIRTQLAQLVPDPLVIEKRKDLDRLIQDCLSLMVDTSVPQAEYVAGEALALHHEVTYNASLPVRWISVRYPRGKGELKVHADLPRGATTARDARQFLATATPVSQPYWVRRAGSPGLFAVDDPKLIGSPVNAPVFPVEYVFEVAGQTFTVADEPVQYVAGASAAQARRALAVIPPVSLGFTHDLVLLAPGTTGTVTVEITAARPQASGRLRLDAPAGWTVTPAVQPFTLSHSGNKAALDFKVTPPANGGSATLTASTEVGAFSRTERFVIDYPHLPLLLLQSPANVQAVALDVQTRGKRVGYLPGAGDSTAESLVQLGYEVTTLGGADLTSEKLAGLDAVVIGVRAFNERSDLAANLPALFAWVEAGGTVIAQYNRPNNLKTDTLGPYPLSIAGPAPALRVTDETAPVTFLAPDHPVLNTPNKITATDFEGWVQERGAYFPSKWDESHYISVLGMSDPGEAQLKSSLLVARHGKGYFVYTGLAFFRQLPAGVPGAQRLFANLVSLGK